MTPFALMLNICGLSQREAAAFLGVRHDTVKSWGAGRNTAPAPVIKELSGLHVRQRRAAAQVLAQLRALSRTHGLPDAIELGLACDDHEAQARGWPCVGAQAAMYGLVIARASQMRFRFVPAGSTAATAAAADRV